jgi:hypothetical protein
MADTPIVNASPTPAAPAATATSAGAPPAAAPASASPAVKAAVAEAQRQWELKIDGRSEHVNEQELIRRAQMSTGAQKRMQQFAEYEKGVKGLFETLQNDPLKVLGDPRLNISPEVRKKMAERIINNEIEEMQKSPEQREKERLTKQYEDLKAQHETEKTAREQAEMSRLTQQAVVQFDNDISAAIEASGLPKTSRTIKQYAEALMICLENNIELSAKDLTPILKKQTLSDFREMIGSLPDDEFESWLGKDQVSRIRKNNLKRLKAAATVGLDTAQKVQSTGQTSRTEAKKVEGEKKQTMKSFFGGLGS